LFTGGNLCFFAFLNLRQRLINFEEKKFIFIKKENAHLNWHKSFLGALSSFFLDHFSNYNTLCGFKYFHTRGFFVFFLVWVYFLAIFFSIFLPQNATNNEQRIFQGGNAVMTKTTWPLVFQSGMIFFIMEGSTIVHRIT